MTLQEAKSIVRHLGLTLRKVRSGDYCVKSRDGNEHRRQRKPRHSLVATNKRSAPRNKSPDRGKATRQVLAMLLPRRYPCSETATCGRTKRHAERRLCRNETARVAKII